MIDVVIKAEDQITADVLKSFFSAHKNPVSMYINQTLGMQGQPVDAGVSVDEVGNVTVSRFTTDKGYILGEVDGVNVPSIALMDYNVLPVGKRYVNWETDRLYLYIKEEQGQPDVKVGAFQTLTDAVKQINSEAVNAAIKQLRDKQAAEEKAAEKTVKRLKKLGKPVPAKA